MGVVFVVVVVVVVVVLFLEVTQCPIRGTSSLNYMSCHTEVADKTCYITLSQYNNTGHINISADPIQGLILEQQPPECLFLQSRVWFD